MSLICLPPLPLRRAFFMPTLLLCTVAFAAAAPPEISQSIQLVDLKSFFHGSPQKPLPPEAKAATVSYAPGVAPDKEVFDFMLAFAEAVRQHDGASLKPRLSEHYTIEEMVNNSAPSDLFAQAIGQLKSPNELIITALEKEGEVRVARVDFQTGGRPAKHRTFKFDPAGKLLSADFFTLRVHGA